MTDLNSIYAPLIATHKKLFAALCGREFAVESTFSIDHFIELKDGSIYQGDVNYPLPVMELNGICSVFANFASIDYYANVPETFPFDMVSKYGIVGSIHLGEQYSDLFLFKMPLDAKPEEIYEFAMFLSKNGAYV